MIEDRLNRGAPLGERQQDGQKDRRTSKRSPNPGRIVSFPQGEGSVIAMMSAAFPAIVLVIMTQSNC
jgi:hypothetical protein